MLISCGSVFEALSLLFRDGNHGEVGVSHARPIHWTSYRKTIRIVLVLIYAVSWMSLDSIVDIGYRFGRNRVKSMVAYTLVTDAWSNCYLHIRHVLITTLERYI